MRSTHAGSPISLSEIALFAAFTYLTLATTVAVGSSLKATTADPLSGLTIPELSIAALASLIAVPLLIVPSIAR